MEYHQKVVRESGYARFIAPIFGFIMKLATAGSLKMRVGAVSGAQSNGKGYCGGGSSITGLSALK